jgi:hypothetical protein
MKVVSIFLFIFFVFGSTGAQELSPKYYKPNDLRQNAIYFELLGNGAIYSFNYERALFLNKSWNLLIRVGGNEYHGEESSKNSYNVVIASGLIYGNTRHFLELGVGYTYFSREPDRLVSFMTGYRYQGPKGLILRVTPMYIINSDRANTEIEDDNFGNMFWFGLSVGHSF